MKILIIKHGAFGDIINAMGAFDTLRHAFSQDHITLMTSEAYQDLAQATPYFDRIRLDKRSSNPGTIAQLCYSLKTESFDWVIDLQNSTRTSRYFQIMKWLPGEMPLWSGIAPGCSHPQRRPDRRQLHAFERFADQLKEAGIDLKGEQALYPEMSWLQADLKSLNLPSLYAVLVPGSSKTGAYKRWPAPRYKELALSLLRRGITPVFVGGPDEMDLLEWLATQVPQACCLGGKLTLLEIGALAREAVITIGNDTGSVHLAAAVGCPLIVLWSGASNPDIFAPRGPSVKIIFREKLADLFCAEVEPLLESLLALPRRKSFHEE